MGGIAVAIAAGSGRSRTAPSPYRPSARERAHRDSIVVTSFMTQFMTQDRDWWSVLKPCVASSILASAQRHSWEIHERRASALTHWAV